MRYFNQISFIIKQQHYNFRYIFNQLFFSYSWVVLFVMQVDIEAEDMGFDEQIHIYRMHPPPSNSRRQRRCSGQNSKNNKILRRTRRR